MPWGEHPILQSRHYDWWLKDDDPRSESHKLVKKFPQLKLASIGPETSKAIAVLGLKPTLEAKEHTTDGLIAALLKSKA